MLMIGGMPLLGYLVGAAAWILTRTGASFLQARAGRSSDPKLRAGLLIAGLMGRVWLVALAVIVARFANNLSLITGRYARNRAFRPLVSSMSKPRTGITNAGLALSLHCEVAGRGRASSMA